MVTPTLPLQALIAVNARFSVKFLYADKPCDAVHWMRAEIGNSDKSDARLAQS
jgi:hypothetical protein